MSVTFAYIERETPWANFYFERQKQTWRYFVWHSSRRLLSMPKSNCFNLVANFKAIHLVLLLQSPKQLKADTEFLHLHGKQCLRQATRGSESYAKLSLGRTEYVLWRSGTCLNNYLNNWVPKFSSACPHLGPGRKGLHCFRRAVRKSYNSVLDNF